MRGTNQEKMTPRAFPLQNQASIWDFLFLELMLPFPLFGASPVVFSSSHFSDKPSLDMWCEALELISHACQERNPDMST